VSITSEVLGAALNWLIKRNIYERGGRKNWPGDAEPHGMAGPYRLLATERAIASGSLLLAVWSEWAIRTSSCPKLAASCPCLSGRALGKCHRELADLVASAIYFAGWEANLNGNR